ncbi:MAG TPA: DNA alkylation repair protein [Micromonosporaceae bacterium]|nr:DNA alkylation repair protein [Micromonosporaceae bacterium]
MTPLAGAVLDRLVTEYGAAADPERAAPMVAYMRDQFPFLGITSVPRRALSRRVLAGLPPPDEADLVDAALACWRLPEREYQLFACDWLVRHAKVLGPGFLPTLRTLVTTKPWWDTVDALASGVGGVIVARHPAARSTMDEWLAGDEMWLIRVALLHQLNFREATDAAWLFAACAARADHKDFFIRKAIGWALRQYARTDPAAVRDFVAAHHDSLSGLSAREALKHL